jgi:hypothetical protein
MDEFSDEPIDLLLDLRDSAANIISQDQLGIDNDLRGRPQLPCPSWRFGPSTLFAGRKASCGWLALSE